MRSTSEPVPQPGCGIIANDIRAYGWQAVLAEAQSRECHAYSEEGQRNVLVSRVESLATTFPACLGKFHEIDCLSPGAEPETEDPGADGAPNNALSGLPAKTYIADMGRYSSVWTNSANAINTAFNGNVEFVTELLGTRG